MVQFSFLGESNFQDLNSVQSYIQTNQLPNATPSQGTVNVTTTCDSPDNWVSLDKICYPTLVIGDINNLMKIILKMNSILI